MGVEHRQAGADKAQECGECFWKKPHFFKVLMGDFRERLMLPPAFLKQLIVGESGEAVVEDQSNRCWDVQLLRRGNGMMFSKGWKQFVEENDLETGDFLVFRHDGQLHFRVTIFDNSSCEKITGKRCPGIKTRDTASSFKTTNPSFRIVMRRNNGIVHIPAAFARANLPNSACWMTLEDSVGQQWSVKYVSTRCSWPNGGHLPRGSLSAGWPKFSADNCLKVGDVLDFELIREKNLMKVHIFRGQQ